MKLIRSSFGNYGFFVFIYFLFFLNTSSSGSMFLASSLSSFQLLRLQHRFVVLGAKN